MSGTASQPQHAATEAAAEGAQRRHSLQLIASGAWSMPLSSSRGEPAQDGRSSWPTSGRSRLCFLLCKEDRALSVLIGTHLHYHGTFGEVKERLHLHTVLFLHYAIQVLLAGVHSRPFFFLLRGMVCCNGCGCLAGQRH